MVRRVAAEDELRKVDDQRCVDVLVGQPAPAFEGVVELQDTLGERDVEAGDGFRSESAVAVERMAGLVVRDGV